MNERAVRHIIMPALMTALFLAVAATPVELIGCRNRGLLAFGIALVSASAGVWAAFTAVRGRMQGDAQSHWWATTALVLSVPAVLVLLLA